MSQKKTYPPVVFEVNRVYRAKKDRPVSVGFDRVHNDRMIIHVGTFDVQYDAPTVRNGRRYPSVSKEKFAAWAGEDVTGTLPETDWAPYAST